MAFPTVVDMVQGYRNLDTTSHTVTLPDNIQSGDLVLVVIMTDGSPTITFPAGWTKVHDSTTFCAAYKVATGDIADIEVTLSASEKACWQSFRIQGYEDIESSTPSGGSYTSSPNPPSLSPSWGSDDTLWIAVTGWDDGTNSCDGYPSNYTSGATGRTYSSDGCGIASARRNLAAATEDPSAFSLTSSRTSRVCTIAIQPIQNRAPSAVDPTRADFNAQATARFSWAFSDPDDGDTQSAFKLRIREEGGAWAYAQPDGTLGAETFVTSSNEYFDLDAGELDNGKSYEWEVQVKDDSELAGVYCDTQSFACYLSFYASSPLPADETECLDPEVDFSAQYDHDNGTSGTLRVQADTVNTFNSADLKEDTVAVTDGNRGTVVLTLPDRGTWYWRVRAECGEDVKDWLATQTVERIAAALELVAPTDDTDADAAPMVFQARGYCDTDTVKVQIEFDTVDTFDGLDYEQQESVLGASGTLREFSKAFTGTDTWYWRVRAVHEDTTVGDWSGPWELYVDTSGAVPTAILPDPESTVNIEIGSMIADWSAELNPVITPTAAPSLRLQAQIDTDPGFTDPTTETSSRVAAGGRATVSVAITEPGTYYIRFRTLADYGDDSAWDDYEIEVKFRTVFTREPSWQGQIGPRPNRVYCRIEGGATYQTAEVPAVDPEDKVDYWVTVPAGTLDAEALATAQAVLAVLQGRTVSVSGPVPITIVAAFDRLVTVQWWELVDDTPTLRETQTLILAKKQHNVDEGTTELFLGDYAPPREETLARILAKLSRKS